MMMTTAIITVHGDVNVRGDIAPPWPAIGFRSNVPETENCPQETVTTYFIETLRLTTQIISANRKPTMRNLPLQMSDEWRFLAMVIDRLLLLVYLVVTVVGTLTILTSAPHIFQFVDQDEILRNLTKLDATVG